MSATVFTGFYAPSPNAEFEFFSLVSLKSSVSVPPEGGGGEKVNWEIVCGRGRFPPRYRVEGKEEFRGRAC